MDLKIRNYIEPTGQRNAIIVESETGMPAFWPMLYVTSKLRAKGLAVTSKNSQLGAILCFYKWAEMRGIDIDSRIASGEGFSRNEIDTLVTLLRSRISDLPDFLSPSSNVIPIGSSQPKHSDIWQTLEEQPKQINASSYNDRLVYVGNYIVWLCDYLSDQNHRFSSEKRELITKIGTDFQAVLRSMKSVEPNTAFDASKSLVNKDIRTILEYAKPHSPLNPWYGTQAQIRNFAIICLLLDTGLRTGELLSLKLKDIIWAKKGAKGLKVKRRQGSKDDPRKKQPGTKRDEREVPLSEGAFKALDLYVSSVRNTIPDASRTEYLIISVGNKSKGVPLSSISPITDAIRDLTGINLTPHKLRHTATWRYCVAQKKQGRKWDEFVDQLCLKFGWSSPQSPTVRHYAKRYLKDKMFESTIREQDQINAEMEAGVAAAIQETKNGD
jgi:site-specific recombinase XerD